VSGPSISDLGPVAAMLQAFGAAFPGKSGDELRAHLASLTELVAAPAGATPEADADKRTKAAAHLDAVVTRLAALPVLQNARGTQTLAGLRGFVAWLRSPTPENERAVEEFMGWAGAGIPQPPPPAPLAEYDPSATVDALAAEAARRQGLTGQAARSAVERMKRDVKSVMARLELRAQDDAARATATRDFATLLDQVLALKTPLMAALAPKRDAILSAVAHVDTTHIGSGMRAIASWLTSSGDDVDAHVAALDAILAEALGPATHPDALRSDADRQADFERDVREAIHAVFHA
jgi:hypothetical protein